MCRSGSVLPAALGQGLGRESREGLPSLNASGRGPGAQTSGNCPGARPGALAEQSYSSGCGQAALPSSCSGQGLRGWQSGAFIRTSPTYLQLHQNIPTFICHFLMRLKWANTNQGFRYSVLTSLYEYLCPADSSDSLLNSKFSFTTACGLKGDGCWWGRCRGLGAKPKGGFSASRRLILRRGLDTSNRGQSQKL